MKNVSVGKFTWKIVILWSQMQQTYKKLPTIIYDI